MIGKFFALCLLATGTIVCIYRAGKFAAGWKEVSKGTGAAWAAFLGAITQAVIAILLFLEI